MTRRRRAGARGICGRGLTATGAPAAVRAVRDGLAWRKSRREAPAQPAFFRLLGRPAGFAMASLAFFPDMGSSISACLSLRLRSLVDGTDAPLSCRILRRSASMRFTTLCGRGAAGSRLAGMPACFFLSISTTASESQLCGQSQRAYAFCLSSPSLMSAFGAERTWTSFQNHLDRWKMTHSRHMLPGLATAQNDADPHSAGRKSLL